MEELPGNHQNKREQEQKKRNLKDTECNFRVSFCDQILLIEFGKRTGMVGSVFCLKNFIVTGNLCKYSRNGIQMEV